MGTLKGRIFTGFRDAVAKGNAVLEWSIQGGAIAKLWTTGSMKAVPMKTVAHPDDMVLMASAIDASLSGRHASVRVDIKNGRIDDIVFTEKADLGSDVMREPRRPR